MAHSGIEQITYQNIVFRGRLSLVLQDARLALMAISEKETRI